LEGVLFSNLVGYGFAGVDKLISTSVSGVFTVLFIILLQNTEPTMIATTMIAVNAQIELFSTLFPSSMFFLPFVFDSNRWFMICESGGEFVNDANKALIWVTL
jgi:hypothetical protein